MSEAAVNITDPYCVKKHDTLSGIAKRSGVSVTALQKLNHISNPKNLAIGQTIYLSEKTSFGVQVLFLDALRHPIVNLSYQLKFDDKTIAHITDEIGSTAHQVTRNARSTVEVWVKNADQQWQQLTKAVSGYGNKLITLVSDSIVVKGKTEQHPNGVSDLHKNAEKKTATVAKDKQAPLPKSPSGTASKNNPIVKTKTGKTAKGQSVVTIGIDLPKDLLEYFASFTGTEIAETDWKQTAGLLICDQNVLKAIAQVESGGRSAFWRLNKADGANIPAIMYERHYFSRLTKGRYDNSHPDISWPTGYRLKKQLGSTDKKMHDGTVQVSDIYSDYACSYLRLINAFKLDPNAALRSCSWGKFQIMGDNFVGCSVDNIKDFVIAMCTSELGQIKLLAGFIQKKPAVWKDRKNHALGKHLSLWEAVKTKDWPMIAYNYNGPSYKTYKYDDQLKGAYEKLN